MAGLQSILLFLLFVLLPNGNSQTCSFQYLRQPPTMLDCDPLGISILLQCSTGSTSDNVTWYWTQSVSEAGVSGTAILPGDTSDNYQVFNISQNSKQVSFTVSDSTLGYYWCEISNAVNVSLRPSTITPVCQPMNSSQQNKCNRSHITDLHHGNDECAEENSTTLISRPPFPTSCVGSPTLDLATCTKTAGTIMTPITANAATPTVANTATPMVANTATPTAANTATPTVAYTATPTVAYTAISTFATTMTTVATTSVLPTDAPTQQSILNPAVITVGALVVVLVVVVLLIIIALCMLRFKKKAVTMKDKEYRSRNGLERPTQQLSIELENLGYYNCGHLPDIDEQEAVPVYSVLGGHEGEYSVSEGNIVTNSDYIGCSHSPTLYSEVTSKPIAEPGIPIQSEYSVANSADDTEQIPSEYALAGYAYSTPEGELPDVYAVVNNPEKQQIPPEENESLPYNKLSYTLPVYAFPDLAKKKPYSPLLNTSESNDESPPPIPPQAEGL